MTCHSWRTPSYAPEQGHRIARIFREWVKYGKPILRRRRSKLLKNFFVNLSLIASSIDVIRTPGRKFINFYRGLGFCLCASLALVQYHNVINFYCLTEIISVPKFNFGMWFISVRYRYYRNIDSTFRFGIGTEPKLKNDSVPKIFSVPI
jgi:hypothetical protein